MGANKLQEEVDEEKSFEEEIDELELDY